MGVLRSLRPLVVCLGGPEQSPVLPFACPPSPGGAEFVEAPKKIFGVNRLAPKAPENVFERPKARRKTLPNILGAGGGGGMAWDDKKVLPRQGPDK